MRQRGFEMTAREARHNATLAKWREIVIACRGSGLSVRDWCEQEGVGLRSYYRHEREFLDLISAEQRGPSGSVSDCRQAGIRGATCAEARTSHPTDRTGCSYCAYRDRRYRYLRRRSGRDTADNAAGAQAC